MGWKSTAHITRNEAKELIMKKLINIDHLSSVELEQMLENLGYGDDINLDYYGYNLNIKD